jgi:hypothetical protein
MLVWEGDLRVCIDILFYAKIFNKFTVDAYLNVVDDMVRC